MKWQPIETALEDEMNCDVLVFCPGEGYKFACLGENGNWIESENEYRCFPTHWIDLVGPGDSKSTESSI